MKLKKDELCDILYNLMGDIYFMYLADNWTVEDLTATAPASYILQVGRWQDIFTIRDAKNRNEMLDTILNDIGRFEYIPYWIEIATYWVNKNRQILLESSECNKKYSEEMIKCHNDNIESIEKTIEILKQLINKT